VLSRMYSLFLLNCTNGFTIFLRPASFDWSHRHDFLPGMLGCRIVRFAISLAIHLAFRWESTSSSIDSCENGSGVMLNGLMIAIYVVLALLLRIFSFLNNVADVLSTQTRLGVRSQPSSKDSLSFCFHPFFIPQRARQIAMFCLLALGSLREDW
jgi:hypothetical protein